MARSPIVGRTSATAVWSGSEVLIWGGVGAAILADGAAYNPAVDSWRKLPDSPLLARYGAAGAWTGSAFFVWGGYGLEALPRDGGPPATTEPLGDGALFDPVTQAWTSLPPAPISARYNASVLWSTTTNEVIVWGGTGNLGPVVDGAAYKPSTNTWRTLAATPLPTRWNHTAAWTGNRMVIYGGNYLTSGGQTQSRDDAAAYDPMTDTWATIATASSGLGSRATLGATGDGGRAVFFGGQNNNAFSSDGATYDVASGAWSALRSPTAAELPAAARREALLWFYGGRLFVFGGFSPSAGYPSDGASYEASSDTWTSFPAGFTVEHRAPVRVWTGRELVVWSGADVIGTFSDGRVYRP